MKKISHCHLSPEIVYRTLHIEQCGGKHLGQVERLSLLASVTSLTEAVDIAGLL